MWVILTDALLVAPSWSPLHRGPAQSNGQRWQCVGWGVWLLVWAVAGRLGIMITGKQQSIHWFHSYSRAPGLQMGCPDPAIGASLAGKYWEKELTPWSEPHSSWPLGGGHQEEWALHSYIHCSHHKQALNKHRWARPFPVSLLVTLKCNLFHYCDVTMSAIASQITSLTIVYFTIYSDADQRKHQSSVSLAFVRGIHGWPVNSLHKWPVTRKMFPFDDVIMHKITSCHYSHCVLQSPSTHWGWVLHICISKLGHHWFR